MRSLGKQRRGVRPEMRTDRLKAALAKVLQPLGGGEDKQQRRWRSQASLQRKILWGSSLRAG